MGVTREDMKLGHLFGARGKRRLGLTLYGVSQIHSREKLAHLYVRVLPIKPNKQLLHSSWWRWVDDATLKNWRMWGWTDAPWV